MANSTAEYRNQRSRDEDEHEPEITAQPRPLADQLELDSSAEPDLSVDPDELGRRFLSEAIEQGDFDPARRGFPELGLGDGPATDAAQMSPNAFPNDTLWERTVDLSVRSGNDAEQLYGPGLVSTGPARDALDEPRESEVELDRVSVGQSSIREISLFDRETNDADEPTTPVIDTEDQGRHARETRRGELGAQVDPRPDRGADRDRLRERDSAIKARVTGIVAVVLRRVAFSLSRLADRLQPSAAHRRRDTRGSN